MEQHEPEYLPYGARTPDFQYRRALRYALPPPNGRGRYIKNPFQDRGRFSNLTLPPLVFDLKNGFPLITERKIGFWRRPIAEIVAFLNGARTLEDMRQYGDEKTWPSWWIDWATKEKCAQFGLLPGDLGPGSYGPVLHDFPAPDGTSFNQFAEMIREIRDFPGLNTHLVTTWMPVYALQNKERSRNVVVAPCHGTVVRVMIIDGLLTLQHVQRSCDLAVGGVGNIEQYAALTLMLAQVLKVRAHQYVHYFLDGHIYENQVDHVKRLIRRRPRPFPTLKITDPSIDDIFAFRPEHFELTDYNPHPAMNDIPVTE